MNKICSSAPPESVLKDTCSRQEAGVPAGGTGLNAPNGKFCMVLPPPQQNDQLGDLHNKIKVFPQSDFTGRLCPSRGFSLVRAWQGGLVVKPDGLCLYLVKEVKRRSVEEGLFGGHTSLTSTFQFPPFYIVA